MKKIHFGRLGERILPFILLISTCAHAQVTVNDTLTGSSSSYGWVARGGACLTAGNGAGTVPACVGLPIYAGKVQVGGITGRLPDVPGQGALRLTNGDYQLTLGGYYNVPGNPGTNSLDSNGAVISKEPFPTNKGVKITFSTTSYGGNGFGIDPPDGGVARGADGISFMLLDATKFDPVSSPLGETGSGLGYLCSNYGDAKIGGITGGYVVVGIDEYGNFASTRFSTNTGASPGYVMNAITVRGAGSVNWGTLSAPSTVAADGVTATAPYYPNSLSVKNRSYLVQKTCMTGEIPDYTKQTGTNPDYPYDPIYASTGIKIQDYPMLGSSVTLPFPMSNQQGVAMPKRGDANLITYDLNITKDNVLSLSYTHGGGFPVPILTKTSLTAGNGPLPANFLFGFGASTGGGSNVHEITCFKAGTLDIASNSAASNLQQSSKVQAGTQVYLSFYHPTNPWGQLEAFNLLTDASDTISIGTVPNWDGSCVLTGGACSATGSSNTALAPNKRRIYSWDGTKGVPFEFAKLAASEKQALGGGVYGMSRIAYLRGDRSNEADPLGDGKYRSRDGILGDILNSSPAWVGFPNLPYKTTGRDSLTNTAIAEFGTSYANFIQANQTRMNVVYTGSNDGMLHGFRAGAYDTAGKFNSASATNDGNEVLAFIPRQVAATIHSETNEQVDFSSPKYGHNSYVDATPGTGDLYYRGAWHTWLVGGLGPGGNPNGVIADSNSTGVGDLYALDITDPNQFNDATNVVIGEWNSNNLVCVNNEVCRDSLGNVYGTPIIRLLHDGNWAVIFGNGRNSATGTAGLFIMSVNKSTGAQTFRFLNTGAASQTKKNGIDYVASSDLDSDHVTDYLYAGDNNGNVWRFDLTSASPNAWKAEATPVFTTIGNQPISTRITVNSSLPPRGLPRVMLAFGTGRSTPQTLDSANTYAPGTQSLYGIWDSNLQAWNTKSAVRYASLPAPQSITAATLQTQTITSSAGVGTAAAPTFRTVSKNPVCWKGSATCANGNTALGWTLALPSAGEQVFYNPVVQFGTFIVNTAVPADHTAQNCTTQLASGFTMAVALDSGGALSTSFFNTVASSAGMANVASVAGIGLSGTGSPLFVTAGKRTFMVQQAVNGKGVSTEVNPAPNGVGKRITWAKLR